MFLWDWSRLTYRIGVWEGFKSLPVITDLLRQPPDPKWLDSGSGPDSDLHWRHVSARDLTNDDVTASNYRASSGARDQIPMLTSITSSHKWHQGLIRKMLSIFSAWSISYKYTRNYYCFEPGKITGTVFRIKRRVGKKSSIFWIKRTYIGFFLLP